MKELVLKQKNLLVSAGKLLTSLALGVIFGSGNIFTDIYPFLLSAVAALSLPYSAVCLLGGFICELIFLNNPYYIYYLAAGILIIAVKLFFFLFQKSENTLSKIITVSSATLIKLAVFIITYSPETAEIILSAFESFITVGFTYLFSVFFTDFSFEKLTMSVSKKEQGAVIISLSAIILSLGTLYISGANLGVIAAAFLLLVIAQKSEKNAVYLSIAFSVALIINSLTETSFFAMLPVALLIVSSFSGAGKYLSALLFVLVCGFGAILLSFSTASIELMFDVTVGAVLFALTPNSVYLYLSADTEEDKISPFGIKDVLCDKLKSASGSIDVIASALEKLSQTKENNLKISSNAIISKTADKICKKCSFANHCWGVKYDDLTDVLDKAMANFKQGKEYLPPRYFNEICSKSNKLLGELQNIYEAEKESAIQNNKLVVAKNSISEAYRTLSYLLSEMSEEITTIYSVDQKATKSLSNILKSEKIPVKKVSVLHLIGGRTSYEFSSEINIPPEKLIRVTDRMGKVKSESFSLPSVKEENGLFRYSFTETQNYELNNEIIYLNKRSEDVSGDNCLEFSSLGYDYVVLCDGMGTGPLAARESTITSLAIKELILGNLSVNSAIKTAGTMLLTKSEYESSCAVDIIKFDKYTGKTTFTKAGGVSSIIKQGRKVTELYANTAPIGIISDTPLYEKDLYLTENDLILTMSDGVSDVGTDWLKAVLSVNKNKTAEEVKTSILNYIKNNGITFSDDATITVTHITKI